jgi:hypothetical protein
MSSTGQRAAQVEPGRSGTDDGDLHVSFPRRTVLDIDYTEDAANYRSTSTDIQEVR